MAKGIVPHHSIDTEASWAYSPYHKWRFGYALLIVVNQYRFPVAAIADTATLNEPRTIEKLIQPIYQHISIIVGDAAYKVFEVINHLLEHFDILLQVRSQIKDKSMKWYHDLINTTPALWLYRKRKPSVEPTFSLIKELFDLDSEKQLPYKGKQYVSSFLMITAITIQIMAIYNFYRKQGLGRTFEFVELF